MRRPSLRKLPAPFRGGENGQALVLFALGLTGLVGIVGMTVDVGRLVWARTQIQNSVDSAALAAAAGMPSTSQATANANQYWADNSGPIQGQGKNVSLTVSFPGNTNRGVAVHGQADVDTWFLKLIGIDHWHVSADGEAASTVLDISLVMDISQSMCDDTYPRVDQRPNMSPGAGAVPTLTQAIAVADTTLHVSNTAPFVAPISNYFTGGVVGYGIGGQSGSTPYWQAAPKTSYQGFTFTARPGLIMIGPAANGELMQITAVNAGAKTLTVVRGVNDKRGSQTDPAYVGVASTKAAHATASQIWMDRNGGGCTAAAPAASGPYQPYDSLVTDAKYFTTLFNSSYDKFGVTYFSSPGATLKSALSSDFAAVQGAIGSMPAPAGGTNTAHGIAVGRQVLDGGGKRANAARVLVLITDGRAKEYCGSPYSASNYSSTSCPSPGGGIEGNPTANGSAEKEAQRAVADGITIFVIGLGAGVDANWLRLIADGGTSGVGPCQTNQATCTYFDAPTAAQLSAAFTSVAQQTHVTLTK